MLRPAFRYRYYWQNAFLSQQVQRRGKKAVYCLSHAKHCGRPDFQTRHRCRRFNQLLDVANIFSRHLKFCCSALLSVERVCRRGRSSVQLSGRLTIVFFLTSIATYLEENQLLQKLATNVHVKRYGFKVKFASGNEVS